MILFNKFKIYILLVLCVSFWSGNFVVSRYIHTQIDAIELSFFRWLFVFVFLLPTLFFIDLKKCIDVFKKNFLILTSLATLGITFYNFFVYIALHSTTATNALIINSATPMLMIALSFLILKSKINKFQIIGIILSTIGVFVIVLKGDISKISDFTFNKGDIWIIISGFSWALYSVLMKFKPKELTHIELFFTLVSLGLFITLPIYLYQGYTLERELEVLSNHYNVFLYVSLFASILSYYFWNLGLEELGAHKTAQFPHLMPLFGAILSYIFLDERLHSYHLLGGFFIGFGIYLSIFLKKKEV